MSPSAVSCLLGAVATPARRGNGTTTRIDQYFGINITYIVLLLLYMSFIYVLDVVFYLT